MVLKNYLHLLRIRQWYKNLVVFLAIFFSGNIFNVQFLLLTFLAFISLCFISSSNYIINDLVDLKLDRRHPEKKHRPLVTGKIGKIPAVILALMLLIVGLWMALSLGLSFLYAVIILFILTQLYTFFLKNIIFADILAIATFFVIRAISGAFVINVRISPWLVLTPFFLSLFLSVGKRHSEIHLLKGKAAATRKVLRDYNHEVTDSLMVISTTLLIISYALYSFLSEHVNLLYTLPFALFVIFRFYYLINGGSFIARNPEKFVFDRQMVIGIFLWVFVTAVIIYG